MHREQTKFCHLQKRKLLFFRFYFGIKKFFRIQNGCTHMRTNLKGKKCGICNEVAVHSGNDCEKFGQ